MDGIDDDDDNDNILSMETVKDTIRMNSVPKFYSLNARETGVIKDDAIPTMHALLALRHHHSRQRLHSEHRQLSALSIAAGGVNDIPCGAQDYLPLHYFGTEE